MDPTDPSSPTNANSQPHHSPQSHPSEDPGFQFYQTEEQQRLALRQKNLSQARRAKVAGKWIQVLIYLGSALELLLGLRFILRLTAANPDNTFAHLIYRWSDPFVAPFSTLFVSPTFDGNRHIFDVNVLVAMVAYLILLLLGIQLVRLIFRLAN